MKLAIIIFIFSLTGSISSAENLVVPPLTKSPRSLFLIKKAKIDNDVGEPVIYPSQKQARSLENEKIFNKYRLQVLDSQTR